MPERPSHAPGRRPDRVLHGRDAALAPGLDLRLPHPRGRGDGRAGAGLHASPTALAYVEELVGARASTPTASCRASRSSSTPTPTSSRRSPSCAPRGACGRRLMRERVRRQGPALVAAAHAHPDLRRLAHGAAAAASTSRARPSRRSAGRHRRARSRCTPTPTTRRSRSRRVEAATLALRTQQIIADETGVASVADPLGGSYFVEQLTDEMEAEASRYIAAHRRPRRHGRGRRGRATRRRRSPRPPTFPARVRAGERMIVGVNASRRRGRRRSTCTAPTPRSSGGRWSACATCAPAATRPPTPAALDALRAACEGDRERDAAADRGRQGGGHAGRDVRRASRV